MLVQIIIDRVSNTNIFNIIEDQSVSTPYLKENQKLQSQIDDDLIEEYLEELGRIANISRSLSTLPKVNEENQALIFQHLNLNSKLRQTGEAIFRQFFPEPLQEFIRNSGSTFLFFHIDPQLASLPLEILHDGKSFLWERFYLGKSIKGQHAVIAESIPKENLNMLIIADPTEDLEWARREGEVIFEHLSTNFPEKKLNIELIGGKSITKLNLLNAILNKDIIHFSGHLHYSANTAENGWVLSEDRILHAREIQKSGAEPLLIFSNSCLSGRGQGAENKDSDWYTNFASSFLKNGKTSYIGTNWELPDTEPTLSFTIRFYDNLLKGETVGKSLQMARIHARDNFSLNDLTWASYLLIGNPMSRIFQNENKIPDLSQNSADETGVQKKAKPLQQLASLTELFEQLVFFMSSIILSNYQYLNLPEGLKFHYPDIDKTLNNVFEALNRINALKVKTIIPNLLETMFLHRDNLYKISGWVTEAQKSNAGPQAIESYIITIQYLVEGFLMDIEFLKNYGFYRVVEPGHRQLNLMGLRNHHRIKEIILPTQANRETQEELARKTTDLVGHCVMYNPVKKIFLDLADYIQIEIQTSKGNAQEYHLKFTGSDSNMVGSKSKKKATVARQ